MKTLAPPRVLAGALLTLAAGWGAVATAAPPAPARKQTPPGRPSVLLVTIDTLRPDALGFAGGTNPTPALDGLARGGFAFPRAVSPVPLTLPAHVSIMTGTLPRRNGVRDNGQPLPPRRDTLAERLRTAGYQTAAFVSGFPLQRIFGLDRGFARYDDDLPDGREGWTERRADATTRRALAYLSAARGPFFVWVHYYDPHDPYDPPRAFWRGGSRGTYDGEVAFVDHYVGELLAGARARSPQLLTVVTADHGEALGEHGELTHGYFVYDSTMLVPLVFDWPGRLQPGRSQRPARLLDVAPTLLDLLGLPALPDADGVSLRPILEGRDQALPAAYLETTLPWTYFGWSPLSALRSDRFKLVHAPRPELYDLAADPGEQQSLDARAHPEAAELRRQLTDIERKGSAHATAIVDPEARERLRALGYVGSGAAAEREPPPNLPDPKDRVHLRAMLSEAEGLLRGGDYARALALFEEVRRTDPANRSASLRAGVALLRLGRAEAAAERLREAVRLDPERAEARFALGDALLRAGRAGESIDHWMELTRLQPRRYEAWFNLGMALLATGKPALAVEALDSAVALRPLEGDAAIAAARAASAAGRHADAAARLRAVQRRQGAKFAAPALLGLALARRGQAQEALPWLRRSTSAETDYADARWELARLLARSGDRAGAKAALQDALGARPQLRERTAADPLLAPLATP
ncbi:MAG: sulfatase-like hydrolase/transferase [Vicinamibacteria bacterium]